MLSELEHFSIEGEAGHLIDLYELMLDDSAHQILVANGSEAKYLTWDMLADHDLVDGLTLYEEFDIAHDLAAEGIETPFSTSYFAEICKQGGKLGLVEITPGTKDHTIRQRYSPKEVSNEVAVPIAGQFANWQLQYGINLRGFLREPRSLKEGEVSGTLVRLGLMGFLLDGPRTEQEVRDFLAPLAHSRDIKSQKSRWIKQLEAHPFVIFKSGVFKLQEDAHEPVNEFLIMLDKARSLDRQFYAEGSCLAEDIFSDPHAVVDLLSRTRDSSNKVAGKIVNYRRLAERIEAVVQGSKAPFTLADLPQMFPGLNQYQLYKLRTDLRAGRLSQVLKITLPEMTDAPKLKDQLVVSDRPRVALAYLALKNGR